MSDISMETDSGEGPSNRPAVPPPNQPAESEVEDITDGVSGLNIQPHQPQQAQLKTEPEQRQTATGFMWHYASDLYSFFTTPIPKVLWVKYEGKAVTGILTSRSTNVDEFKDAIKTKLELTISAGDFDVYTKEKGAAARPGYSLKDAFYDAETKKWFGVSDENPLIAKNIQTQSDVYGLVAIETAPLSALFSPNQKANVLDLGPWLMPFVNGVGRTPPLSKFLVTGTPGIGKTLFLLYAAYRLVTERGKTVYLHLALATKMFIVSPDGVKKISGTSTGFPKGDDWYYLIDSKEPSLESCAMTILTASPRVKFANEYAKDAKPFYYMPLWTWEELVKFLEAVELQVDQDDLKYRFEILGGVPRKLFEFHSSAEKPESDLKESIAHLLLLYDTSDDFTKYTARYASRYVSLKVYENLRGQLYEYIAHEKLMKGGTFEKRVLHKNNSKSNAVNVVIPASSGAIKDFSSLDVAFPSSQQMEISTYFLPKYGFEAVDSWIQGFGMFHMTVRKNHELKSLVHEVSEKCGSKDLYFVVPDESKFREYRYVEPEQPKPNVKQVAIVEYALWIPAVDEV
ncbi:hypothetical protein MP638_004839 [Amoeboaphelidium occidentale]|nr:hypothetical protein MP638_004839 [Amoeboaphelidium occidentale]